MRKKSGLMTSLLVLLYIMLQISSVHAEIDEPISDAGISEEVNECTEEDYADEENVACSIVENNEVENEEICLEDECPEILEEEECEEEVCPDIDECLEESCPEAEMEETVEEELLMTTMTVGIMAIPNYDSSTQTWTVSTGEELHYAVDNAVSGDIFLIMNDLVMGENIGLSHGRTDGDGIAREIILDKNDTTLTFKSGTEGKVTIYRVDQRRHIVIGRHSVSTPSITASNVTVNFENVVLDGLQTYDPTKSIYQTPSDTSRGGIAILDSENIYINGLEITNCFSGDYGGGDILGEDQVTNGGGINAWYVNNLVITDSKIYNNVASKVGAGIALHDCSVTFTNVTIEDNILKHASDGGMGAGIAITGYDISDQLLLENCTIKNNKHVSLYLASSVADPSVTLPDENSYPSRGGGIHFSISDGTLTLKNTTISGNSAHMGGGIYAAAGGTFTMIDSTISENSATNENENVAGNSSGISSAYGGAIAVFSTEQFNFDFEGTNVIKDNSAYSKYYAAMGGGLYLTDHSGDYIFNEKGTLLIEGNTSFGEAAGYGGGLYFYGYSGYTLSFGENIIFRNNQAGDGGAIFLSIKNALTVITDAEINGNSALEDGGGIYVNAYNNLYLDGVAFNSNTAGNGAYYLSPGDDDYQAGVDLYNQNILNTKSLSLPFLQASGDFAYNNYDINYQGKTPAMTLTVEYYEDGILLGSEVLNATGASGTPEALLIAELGAGWMNLHAPTPDAIGEPDAALPTQFTVPDTLIKVNFPQYVITMEYYVDGLNSTPIKTETLDKVSSGSQVGPTAENWLGTGWLDLYKPANYQSGKADLSLSEKIYQDTTVKVLYTKEATVPVGPAKPNTAPPAKVNTGNQSTVVPWLLVTIGAIGLLIYLTSPYPKYRKKD